MAKPRIVVARHGNALTARGEAPVRVLRHGVTPQRAAGPALRLAAYASSADNPRIVDIALDPLDSFVERATRTASETAREMGGSVPVEALREVVANLIHADFRDASIVIAAGGNEISVCDRGGGVADKDKALLPGYTTATVSVREHVRGVGLGLPRARQIAQAAGWVLTVDDNLGGGTVVRLKAGAGAPVAQPVAEAAVLSDREMRALLLLGVDGGGGPSLVAAGLEVSLSTAHRLLERLQRLGLVICTPKGKRELSAYALANFERLVRTGG